MAKCKTMTYSHIGELVHQQAKKLNRKTALKYQDVEGEWVDMTWDYFSDRIMKTSQAMAELGVMPDDNVGVYSQNMAKYLVTDFAAYANKAVMVPMYATSSPEQVSYIVTDAHVKLLFVGEQFQYNNAFKVQQSSDVLQRLIVFDQEVVLHPEDETSVYFDDFIASGDKIGRASCRERV